MTGPLQRGGSFGDGPFGDVPMPADDVDPYALWDAAYVLGSLTRADRRDYEVHLTGCPSCRSAVGELSGMPSLLAMLTPFEVTAIDDGGLEVPPMQPRLLDELLNKVRRRRRNVRWMTWAASAAAASVLAVGVLLAIRPGALMPAQPSSLEATAAPVSMSQVVPSTIDATVSVTSQSWGTHVALTCTYGREGATAGHDDDAGDRLAMVAVGRDGTHDQLATWMAQEGVTASPTGSTSMPVDDIASVQIVSVDSGDVLLERNF